MPWVTTRIRRATCPFRRRGWRQHLFGGCAHVLVHPAWRAHRGAGVARDPGALGATVHQEDEGLAVDPGPARGRRHGSGPQRDVQVERGGPRDRAVASGADSRRHQCRGLPRAVHDAGLLAGGKPDHLQHGAHDRGSREPRDAAVRGGHRPARPLQAGHADGSRAEGSGTGQPDLGFDWRPARHAGHRPQFGQHPVRRAVQALGYPAWCAADGRAAAPGVLNQIPLATLAAILLWWGTSWPSRDYSCRCTSSAGISSSPSW